jgi:uncharacterized membrane protein
MPMNATLRWLGATAIVAGLVHVATTWYAPRFIMGRTMDVIAGTDGANVFINRPVADADARGIVRPSPDLMYSLCVLDLAQGPVHIRAPASTPYTSVSVFAANSDNVFVQNDRALADGAGGFDIWVVREGQTAPAGATVARLPSARGIALVRRVITDPQQALTLDALRREASCDASNP